MRVSRFRRKEESRCRGKGRGRANTGNEFLPVDLSHEKGPAPSGTGPFDGIGPPGQIAYLPNTYFAYAVSDVPNHLSESALNARQLS